MITEFFVVRWVNFMSEFLGPGETDVGGNAVRESSYYVAQRHPAFDRYNRQVLGDRLLREWNDWQVELNLAEIRAINRVNAAEFGISREDYEQAIADGLSWEETLLRFG